MPLPVTAAIAEAVTAALAAAESAALAAAVTAPAAWLLHRRWHQLHRQRLYDGWRLHLPEVDRAVTAHSQPHVRQLPRQGPWRSQLLPQPRLGPPLVLHDGSGRPLPGVQRSRMPLPVAATLAATAATAALAPAAVAEAVTSAIAEAVPSAIAEAITAALPGAITDMPVHTDDWRHQMVQWRIELVSRFRLWRGL